MKYFMTMSLVLLLASGAIFAQRANFNMGGGNLTTIMLKTDKGLFALRSGVLVKYDATTLQQIAEYKIFGDAPTAPVRPTDMTDQAAVAAWRTDMQTYTTSLQKRQGAALMISTKDSLLIVIGDGFGRISQDTLKPEAKASLLPPATAPAVVDPNAPAAPVRQTVEPVPGYVLDGTTLFLMRAKEVLSINTVDGTIIARSTLPVELQPAAQNMFNPGGGRGGAGGNGGAAGGGAAGGRAGGRGGRGGAAGGANPATPAAPAN